MLAFNPRQHCANSVPKLVLGWLRGGPWGSHQRWGAPGSLCHLTVAAPGTQDMLDQYGPQDSKLHGLDSALKDAVQMVRVSDQRISYLRKMHALLLLKR